MCMFSYRDWKVNVINDAILLLTFYLIDVAGRIQKSATRPQSGATTDASDVR